MLRNIIGEYFMKAYIETIQSAVPANRVSNSDLAKTVDTSDDWIVSHTGIKNRHIAGENEAASDLGRIAAEKAFAKSRIAPDDIDMILVATSSSDYPNFPSTACIIQNKLGIKGIGAFDISAGCTGFVYALDVARAYINSGIAQNILVIASEVLTKITNWEDRNTCILFGDGAGAAIVTQNDGAPESHIAASYLRSKGSGEHALMRAGGGTKAPYKEGESDPADLLISMDGKAVYLFAVKAVVKSIHRLLELSGLTIDDIPYIVPHQANIRIIEAAAKRFGISSDRFYTNIDEYANTSAASIPIAMAEMDSKGLLERGTPIITVGFGAGLTYGGNVIYW
jgi:3-oxoacyl-[acyl-carrier-protein] synthase III